MKFLSTLLPTRRPSHRLDSMTKLVKIYIKRLSMSLCVYLLQFHSRCMDEQVAETTENVAILDIKRFSGFRT